MKSFKFELEQLLRVKRWREEEAKKALAVEVQALESMRAKLAELEAERLAVLGAGVTVEQDMIDHRERLGILQYAQFMGTLISGAEGNIAAQGGRIQEKSDLLLKAMQQRKVLEKLRERKREEYGHLRLRFEYAALDESSARFLQRAAAADPRDTAESDGSDHR